MIEMNDGMTGYERLLVHCNDDEKNDIKNAIKVAGNTLSCMVSHFDEESQKKIVVVRPPLYEKWAVSIADYEKDTTKIICEDGTVNCIECKQKACL